MRGEQTEERETRRNKKKKWILSEATASKTTGQWAVLKYQDKMYQGNVLTRHWISDDSKISLAERRLLVFPSLLFTWNCWQRSGSGQVAERPVSGYAKLFCCYQKPGCDWHQQTCPYATWASFASVPICVHPTRKISKLCLIFKEYLTICQRLFYYCYWMRIEYQQINTG